ncbi:MAG: HPr family phosphocarrier protein [Ignavibacteria bacterium]|nr:HPr family phosphocarrier protein [Ignavibacteria bacterium]
MVEKVVKVINRSGIHTRPAASIVKLASKFKSEIFLIRDKFAINGKSIIGVMTLAAEQGSEIKVRAEGPDEQEAIDEIVKLFESGFGEV